MSLHIHRAMSKAAEKGGYAGQPNTLDIWQMSKRELVEIALRLGELCSEAGCIDDAANRVREERRILAEQGII